MSSNTQPLDKEICLLTKLTAQGGNHLSCLSKINNDILMNELMRLEDKKILLKALEADT